MKVKKNSLRNMSEFLTDNEMKSTRGGDVGYGIGNYTCVDENGQETWMICDSQTRARQSAKTNLFSSILFIFMISIH